MSDLTQDLSLPARVADMNARTLVLQIRKLAKEAEGAQRTEFRNLVVEAETLERRLAEALRS